ncbi:hypothetical protein Q9233_011638 [Columba guinea]|nr:hypothetical protein Q9233_011638 [Columba guinea]
MGLLEKSSSRRVSEEAVEALQSEVMNPSGSFLHVFLINKVIQNTLLLKKLLLWSHIPFTGIGIMSKSNELAQCFIIAHSNSLFCSISSIGCITVHITWLVKMATAKSAAAAPSPVLGNIPPGDGMPVGPVPPGFFQPFMSPRYPGGPRPPLRIPNQALGGVPGSQPLLPSGMDPTRQQGHPNMGGPMQRMTPPRGMVPLGPQSDPWLSLQNYGGAMRPPLNALGGPGMPGMNMGPGGGRPWPNPTNANSIPYSSASPGNYVGPPGGGGPPGTPIMPSPADSTNSGDNMYTLMNAVPPGPNRPNFPMGPGSDGPMSGLGGMDSHHMNGSLGSGDMDSISKNSPSNMSMSNQPGTPRDDGEMGGNFLNPFQSESISVILLALLAHGGRAQQDVMGVNPKAGKPSET